MTGYDDYYRPQVAFDDKPYTTLGYTNGPGYLVHRLDRNGQVKPRMNLSQLPMDIISGFTISNNRYFKIRIMLICHNVNNYT